MSIHRAAERYETRQDGIVTLHCFSADSHYDPDNLSFGPLLGVDEHVVEPGAGFAEHPHRGVEIISWIADGQLTHSTRDETQVINADESLIQDATETIHHTERNDGDEPLRLIQTTLLAGSNVEFAVIRAEAEFETSWLHLFVVDGSWDLAEYQLGLRPGDSVRIADHGRYALTGTGTVLALHRA